MNDKKIKKFNFFNFSKSRVFEKNNNDAEIVRYNIVVGLICSLLMLITHYLMVLNNIPYLTGLVYRPKVILWLRLNGVELIWNTMM